MPSSTRSCASCARSRRRTPTCVTPDSPTQRVGGQPVEGFDHGRPPGADAQPRQRLHRSTSCARSTSGSGRAWASPTAPIDYVAELKIDGLSIALTYENGLLVAGRHARRRRARRRRDRQRPDDPRDPARPASTRRPATLRGARRDLPSTGGVRARQPGTRGGRRTGVCQPAQRRGWRHATARSA